MRTKSINLYYNLTPTKIIAPSSEAKERKEEWIKQIQRTIPSEWQPVTLKVTYKIHNREVERQRKFFNGPVVEYWVIQATERTEGRPSRTEIARARETLLYDALGYEVELMEGLVRKRKSTSTFTDTQEWNDLLETLREIEFEPNGYEMPNSERFWELAKEMGYEQAKGHIIDKLQERLRKRLSTEPTGTSEN